MSIIKTIISLLTLIFVISVVLFSSTPVFAGTETQSSAGTKIQFIPSTSIPGSDFVARDEELFINSSSLGKYIIAIYNYGVGLVSVLAVVMIMFGGFKWIFAAGNASRIGDAKSTIISALVGLALALGSFMILNTISPALTSFKPLYTPKPQIAACPWHIRTCTDVNSYFHYVQSENEKLSDSAVKDAIDSLSKRFKLKPVEGDYSEQRQLEIQQKICENVDGSLASCSIPAGICFYDSTEGCFGIAQVECKNNPNICKESIQNAFCQTKDYHCSVGVRGSVCANDSECKDNGLSCVDNKCFKPGKEGESCDKNSQCAAGLVCSDDDEGIITPDKCVPGAVECTYANIEQTCFNGNYREEPGWGVQGAFCRVNQYDPSNGWCDCNEDADCDPGYRCVDVKSDVVDRDVCLPSSYR